MTIDIVFESNSHMPQTGSLICGWDWENHQMDQSVPPEMAIDSAQVMTRNPSDRNEE
jgi:hypothetical protein